MPSLSPSRIRGRRAFGGVLFVPLQLQRLTFDFLVDTGAAYSAISPALASVFNLTAIPNRNITIAPAYGTPVRVPRVLLPETAIPGMPRILVTTPASQLAFRKPLCDNPPLMETM